MDYLNIIPLSIAELIQVQPLLFAAFQSEQANFKDTHYVHNRLSNMNNPITVTAQVNSEVIGVAIGYEQIPKVYYLWRIAVQESQRGKGIGKALVSRMLDEAVKYGYKDVQCKTWNFAREMMHLLISFEFNIIGTQFYKDQLDTAILWEKVL